MPVLLRAPVRPVPDEALEEDQEVDEDGDPDAETHGAEAVAPVPVETAAVDVEEGADTVIAKTY